MQKPDRLCRHKNNKAIRLAEDFDSNGRLTALFKIALCVERCHAPRARARHRLAVDGIGTVAGGKDALDVGGCGRKTGLVGHDIAALSVELFGKDLRKTGSTLSSQKQQSDPACGGLRFERSINRAFQDSAVRRALPCTPSPRSSPPGGRWNRHSRRRQRRPRRWWLWPQNRPCRSRYSRPEC